MIQFLNIKFNVILKLNIILKLNLSFSQNLMSHFSTFAIHMKRVKFDKFISIFKN